MEVRTEHGTTIVVHDLGGDGSPLLICHATGFCGMAYAPLAGALRGRHHVWAVDVRGHGDSPPPEDGDFAWMGIVEDVLAACRAIGEGRQVHAIGHSRGGAVALQAEADHPGTFASAYLFEPIIPGDDFPMVGDNPMAVSARKRRERFPSKEAVLWRYASRPPFDGIGAASLVAYVEHGFATESEGTVRLKCRPEHEARTFEAAGVITAATVAPAALPVVVATGSASASPVASFAPGVVDALPDARLVVHEHLGHFGPFQDVQTVARDVLALTAG